MKISRQTTIRESFTLSGIGVHSNEPVHMVISPAPADTGIIFYRTDLAQEQAARPIRALWHEASVTQLCTTIGTDPQERVATIEHLLAAFAGVGVDNAFIDINGPEVPILDGSAGPIVEEIDRVGLLSYMTPRRYLKILKPIRIQEGRSFSELQPARSGFRLDVEIDFQAPIIGHQRLCLDLEPGTFRRTIAKARTFGFMRDVEKLWQAGFARGASLENTIALEDTRVLNPEGLRYKDEYVRHKLLDAIGDLSLAGAPLIGTYRSYCGGHKMNVSVLKELFANPTAYAFVTDPSISDENQTESADDPSDLYRAQAS